MNKTIDIKASLQFGFDTLRANVPFFLKLLLVLLGAAIVPAIVFAKIGSMVGPALNIPLQFLMLVWQSILGMGVVKICLKLYDQQPVEIHDMWSVIPQTLDFIIVKFVVSIITVVGLILLIVPGLIWMMQFYLSSYLVIDRGMGAIAALKGSSKVTHGAKWDLGIYASVIFLLNLVGIICLGVGLMITLPISMLATVYVYRKLLAETETAGAIQ